MDLFVRTMFFLSDLCIDTNLLIYVDGLSGHFPYEYVKHEI